MKTLRFVMYILYRYYSKGGTKRIPYFSALSAVVLLIYIHIFQLLIVFNKVDEVIPLNAGDGRPMKYLKLLLFLLPVFFIVAFLVKPNDLEKMRYDARKVRRGGIILTIYSVVSFLLLFVLAFLFPQRP